MSEQPTETRADEAVVLADVQTEASESEETVTTTAPTASKAQPKRVTKTPRKTAAKSTARAKGPQKKTKSTNKAEIDEPATAVADAEATAEERVPEGSVAETVPAKRTTQPKKAPAATAAKRRPRSSTVAKAAAGAKAIDKDTQEDTKAKSVPRTAKASAAKTPRPATAQNRRASSISSRAATMRKYDLAIRVTGLAKSFDETAAVDTINFDVPRGKIYGIVGPNGAGKTTTLLMLAGLLRPDHGRITVNDYDVWTDPNEAKALMGIMLDRFVLFDRLTGWQMLYYTGVLRGMKHAAVRQRSEELVKLFRLENSASRLVQDYSAGMLKKLSLACAMMHSPEVLILDEPFESVDPVSAQALIRVLKEQTEQGVTVILSSHDMNLVSKTCDFLAVIIEGRVLDQGEIGDVLQGKTLEERFSDLAGAAALGDIE